MNESLMLTVASSLVATLFGLLVVIVGWMGSKLYSKLDEMSKNLVSMAGELHDRITTIDKRLVKIETEHSMQHQIQQ